MPYDPAEMGLTLPEIMRRRKLEEALMRGSVPKPYIWSSDEPRLTGYGDIPSMIPGSYGGDPGAMVRGSAAVLSDPLRSIPIPPPPAPVVPPQAQQPTGWRNVISQVGTAFGDALQGAATPNIAGGGPFDVIRSMAVGQQAAVNRRELERRQRLEEEARQRQIEEHKQQMRIRELEAEASIELRKSQKEHYEELKKKTENAAAAPPKRDITKFSTGAYDWATDKWLVPPARPTDQARMKEFFEKSYADALKAGDEDAENYNPDSEENQELIKYGRYGNSKDKHPYNRVWVALHGTPEDKANLAAMDDAVAKRQQVLARIRKAGTSGGMTNSEMMRLTGMVNAQETALQNALNRADVRADIRLSDLRKSYPANQGLAPPQAMIDQIETDKNAQKTAALALHDKNVTNIQANMDPRLGSGGATPAAGAAGAGRVTPAAGAAGGGMQIGNEYKTKAGRRFIFKGLNPDGKTAKVTYLD